MSDLNPLEQTAVLKLLGTVFDSQTTVMQIFSLLRVERREFSTDLLPSGECAGFFVHFVRRAESIALRDIPHHVSLHVGNSELSLGGDFILFFDREKKCLDFLEVNFFDSTMNIEKLKSDAHGFEFPLR